MALSISSGGALLYDIKERKKIFEKTGIKFLYKYINFSDDEKYFIYKVSPNQFDIYDLQAKKFVATINKKGKIYQSIESL